MPLSNVHTNHPHCSRAERRCRQPTHLCYDISFDPCPAFMSLLIACVYSQTSWETVGGWEARGVLERATGTQEETERFLLFLCQNGKNCCYSTTQPTARETNICFWAISANHSQSGSYLNIDECFSPLIKPYQKRPEWPNTWAEEWECLELSGLHRVRLQYVVIKTFNCNGKSSETKQKHEWG